MKIAVVGSGISGLGAAYLLSKKHEVHLFEADQRLGGHAHTVEATEEDRPVPMDTGFLVYNELTYPHLTGFFRHLDVETTDSDMSLSIQVSQKNLEWSGSNLNTVFGQRRNLFRPSFHRMLLEILRFHREAEKNLGLSQRHAWTLSELLKARNFSHDLCDDYLLPMSAAIWSTPEKGMLDFPAATFLTFMLNHKLVQVNDRPIWKTVKNGSIQYVQKVAQKLPFIHLKTPVLRVKRTDWGVHLKTAQSEAYFDHVVMATHAPVTAKILETTDELERQVLGSFQYEGNQAFLHQDRSLMPKSPRCWASWNVRGRRDEHQNKVSLSYHLNRLQPLATKKNYFLTLNPETSISQSDREFYYEHPRFTQKAIRAQRQLPEIQGRGGIYFAGAWTRYGFHEDGLLSAVNVAKLIGAEVPWAQP